MRKESPATRVRLGDMPSSRKASDGVGATSGGRAGATYNSDTAQSLNMNYNHKINRVF